MDRYETIVLTDDQFGEELWCKVSAIIKILTEAEYTCQVSLEEKGIVRIDYNYDEYMGFGNATPQWLYPDETEVLEAVLEDIFGECND